MEKNASGYLARTGTRVDLFVDLGDDVVMTSKIVFTKDPFTKKTCYYTAVGSAVAWIYRTSGGWKTAIQDSLGTKWFDDVFKSRKIAERAVLSLLGVST